MGGWEGYGGGDDAASWDEASMGVLVGERNGRTNFYVPICWTNISG